MSRFRAMALPACWFAAWPPRPPEADAGWPVPWPGPPRPPEADAGWPAPWPGPPRPPATNAGWPTPLPNPLQDRARVNVRQGTPAPAQQQYYLAGAPPRPCMLVNERRVCTEPTPSSHFHTSHTFIQLEGEHCGEVLEISRELILATVHHVQERAERHAPPAEHERWDDQPSSVIAQVDDGI